VSPSVFGFLSALWNHFLPQTTDPFHLPFSHLQLSSLCHPIFTSLALVNYILIDGLLKTLLLKEWPRGQQCHLYRGAWEKSRLRGPSPNLVRQHLQPPGG
jgi:hypothetical protein